MSRYYFQAHYRGLDCMDEVGEEFPTLEEARAHAAAVATELSCNAPEQVTVDVLSHNGCGGGERAGS